MAFSNVWSNVIPAGSDPANTADDEIRQLRLDIDERMDTVVGDWSADPLFVLTDIRKSVHWSDGVVGINDTGWDVTGLGLHPSASPSNFNWNIHIPLPVGAILNLVDFRIFLNNASSTFIVGVNELNDTPGSTSLGSTTIVTIPGWQTITISGLAHTVLQDRPIVLSHFMSNLIDFTGTRIFMDHYEYDLPSAITGAIA